MSAENLLGAAVTLYDDAKANKTGHRIAGTVIRQRGQTYTIEDPCGYRYAARRSEFQVYKEQSTDAAVPASTK